MKSVWIRNAAGVVALSACLAAASAKAQMGGSGMGMPSTMGSPGGQMQRPGMPGSNIPGQQNNMNSMMEQSFLRGIAENGQAEMNLSKMALTNSSNDNVKKLAQQMIQDHQRVDSDVSQAANTRNVVVSQSVPGRVKKEEKKLQELTGASFDQAYLKDLDHYVKDDQSRTEQVAGGSNSADIRELAMEVQNMNQVHNQQIQEAAKSENLALK